MINVQVSPSLTNFKENSVFAILISGTMERKRTKLKMQKWDICIRSWHGNNQGRRKGGRGRKIRDSLRQSDGQMLSLESE